MVRILLLEDDRSRVEIFNDFVATNHEMTHVDQAAKAIDALFDAIACDHPFEVIFLDHDLGGLQNVAQDDINTGSEVVRYMISNTKLVAQQPTIIIHSHNHPAAERMSINLREAGFNAVHVIPFGTLCSSYFRDPTFLS